MQRSDRAGMVGSPLLAVVLLLTLGLAAGCAASDTSLQASASSTVAAPTSTTSLATPSSTNPPGSTAKRSIGAAVGSVTPEATSTFMAKVAEETTAVNTGAFSVNIVVDHASGAPDHVALFDMTGAYDKDADATQLTLDMAGLATAAPDSLTSEGADASMFSQPIEVVQVGKDEWIKIPGMTGLTGSDQSWFKTDSDSGVSSSFQELFDMFKVDDISGFLATLQASGKVAEVGKEDLDGASTIHYHADVDPTHLDTTKNASAGKLLGSFSGATTAAVDVWVDSTAIVHKLSIAADAGALGPELGTTYHDGTATLTMQLSKLGEDVAIEPPPDDQVMGLPSLGDGGTTDDSTTDDSTTDDSTVSGLLSGHSTTTAG